jgi:hypothetical protein
MVTTVKVSFIDASGALVRAQYTDHTRANGKEEGRTVQIVYDPNKVHSTPGHDELPHLVVVARREH